MQEEKFYTPAEIAERYRVQPRTVWEWIRTGKLRAVKVGNYYRIREADLEAFVK